ncbi:adenylosuccinate synthetase [Tamlana sp. 2_MG-2023]|uniref:adenylosuccinate synthetase n=1 Tax=unclassified Tamlana TaxID=2614803 RepID=UPI0026E2B8D7|nr:MULTISPECIES: adenylosuccinate synthetase [unclassified Tamlana]MDO6759504.1 adenylosuccinate synthetase [Tamlana sp. 2_MG-2023]MDO6790357.1 adenylosuccinate synthetase [Tamlana sp. 1_MG-2023]
MLALYQLLLQIPMGTPNPDDNEKVDLSNPLEVIVFIVIPIAIIALYFFWRRKKNK